MRYISFIIFVIYGIVSFLFQVYSRLWYRWFVPIIDI